MKSWRGWPLARAEVNSLVPLHPPATHRPVFLENLRQDLATFGVKNPLIVTLMSSKLLEAHYFKHSMADPPNRPALAVIVGNQRWHILREIANYVDICIVDSVATGNALGAQMRKGFEYLHESRNHQLDR